MTQFAAIVILHLLLRRKWDIGQYLSQSTYQKAPSYTSDLAHPPSDWYLGANPEYMKWRNHTCDCLDVLHWEALSVSAKAGGLESPVFLHLYLARLVILTPVCELFGLAYAAIGSTANPILPHNLYSSTSSDSNWRRTVLVWAHQDRYKARLAVVHAGAILWHFRRYSSDSFIQPFAIFLATLVLWSFGAASKIKVRELRAGSLHPAELQQRSTAGDSPVWPNRYVDATEIPLPDTNPPQTLPSRHSRYGLGFKRRRMPTQMQLDRPMDDELVQHFIRSDGEMRLCLEGVNDLCSDDGLTHLLHEAYAALLEPPIVWTVSESYASVLQNMISKDHST